MNKSRIIIGGAIGLIAVALIALLSFAFINQPTPAPAEADPSLAVDCNNLAYDAYAYDLYERSLIKGLSECIDYNGIDATHEVAPSAASGNLPENSIGPTDAPITIVEFADYQCTHCAEQNTFLSRLISEHPDQIRLVFRTYILSYNEKGVRAAAAAEAAAIQGYWYPFKNLVFSNQSSWYYLGNTRFQSLLEEYFVAASGGKGNLDQFRSDMQSSAVSRKIAFDLGLGNQVGLTGTPTFYINGQKVESGKFQETVTSLLDKSS